MWFIVNVTAYTRINWCLFIYYPAGSEARRFLLSFTQVIKTTSSSVVVSQKLWVSCCDSRHWTVRTCRVVFNNNALKARKFCFCSAFKNQEHPQHCPRTNIEPEFFFFQCSIIFQLLGVVFRKVQTSGRIFLNIKKIRFAVYSNYIHVYNCRRF